MNATRDSAWADRFDAVLADYLSQLDRGARPDRDAFLDAHPDLAEDLAGYFEVQDRMERLAGAVPGAQPSFGLGGGPGYVTVAAAARQRAEARGAAAAGGVAALGVPLLPGLGQPFQPSPQPNDPPLPAGSLLGQYKLLDVIGEGGMGRVYRARHSHLGRVVAIKVLAPHLCRDGALVQRFHREARALARLQHEGIVSIHDMGSQGDVHYFVMEHVEGHNLRQQLVRGPLSPDRALELTVQVCEALQYAHDQGIVHRDIKPENILLDGTGRPKVADFGLAKVLDDGHAPANLTRTDMLIGTFNYMAPEQKHSARVDQRADLYALGVVLYELLTGKLPAGRFRLPSHEAHLPHGSDELLLKALASEPDERYQQASALAADCRSVLAGRGAPGALGESPAPSLPTELVVIDASDDRVLGRGAACWLRLHHTSDDELEVLTWTRDEVAIHCDSGTKDAIVSHLEAPSGPWAGPASLGTPGLQVRLGADDCKVFVPQGLPVTVAGQETEVSVTGLRTSLRIEPGEGSVHVRDHVGRLEIDRVDDGSAFVERLTSSDLRLSTRGGNLTVAGLAMTSGHGLLHTDDGTLALGLDTDECSVAVEARSLSGGVSSELTELTGSHSWMSGRVGAGAARLDLDSYSGSVRLGHGADLVRAEMYAEALKSLGWSALWVAAAFWAGWGWLGWTLIVWWGFGSLVKVLKRYGRVDRHRTNAQVFTDWVATRCRRAGSGARRPGEGPPPGLTRHRR